MPYTHVLLDLDHTLLDTDHSLKRAFVDSMAVADTDSNGHYATFNEINQALWRKVEAQELTAPEVHVTRFQQLQEALELDADPQAMADAFAVGMGQHGELYDGARTALESLSSVATLAMVTNGLSDIQRARIDRLDLAQYFEAITISAEVACAKPGTEIFDITFRALGEPDRTGALMVGDSLASDIRGGNNAGIDTCWFNPNAQSESAAATATHTIESLSELEALVR